MTLEVMDRFLENYEPDMPRYGTQSVMNFQKSVGGYLPPEVNRVTYLDVPVKGYSSMVMLGIVIATNLSEEDMALAKRPDLVKRVQRLLQIDTPPAWYRFGEL
jgi:hypothetical protein